MTNTVKNDILPGKIAAYALLEHHPEEGSLRKTLDQFDPDILSGANILSERPDGLDAKRGDLSISLMVINNPYPDEELQTYCRQNRLQGNVWSQASKTVSHVAVVVRTPAGTPLGKDIVFLVGRIIVALCPKAVLWSSAKSVFSIDDFARKIQSAQSAGDWPYQTMISVIQTEDHTHKYIHTRGLFDFIGHEISWPIISGDAPDADPAADIQTLFEIAKYLLKSHIALKSGETVEMPGATDVLRAHLRHLPDTTVTFELHVETHSNTAPAPPKEQESKEIEVEQSHTPRTNPGPDHSPEHKIRARILHKEEKPQEYLTGHRRPGQRSAARSRQDPRDTIDNTLAAIRKAAAEASPAKEETHPRWMFWKKFQQ